MSPISNDKSTVSWKMSASWEATLAARIGPNGQCSKKAELSAVILIEIYLHCV